VHVSPPEASTSGLVAELERRGVTPGTRVLAPVPLVTGRVFLVRVAFCCVGLVS